MLTRNSTNPVIRPVFDINSINDLDILVTRNQDQMNTFIEMHFVSKQFVAFDMEFEEGIRCKCLVSEQTIMMSTADIAKGVSHVKFRI